MAMIEKRKMIWIVGQRASNELRRANNDTLVVQRKKTQTDKFKKEEEEEMKSIMRSLK